MGIVVEWVHVGPPVVLAGHVCKQRRDLRIVPSATAKREDEQGSGVNLRRALFDVGRACWIDIAEL